MTFARPEGIKCQDWEPADPTKPTAKRCRYYLAPTTESNRGLCSLPTRFSCEEWDRANPTLIHVRTPNPTTPGATSAPPPAATGPRQAPLPVYMGSPTQDDGSSAKGQAKGQQRRSPVVGLPTNPGPDVLVSIQSEQVEALRSAGLEVQLASDDPLLGRIWLVPELTGEDRTELTFESAATLRMIADVFPGARVLTVRRASPGAIIHPNDSSVPSPKIDDSN